MVNGVVLLFCYSLVDVLLDAALGKNPKDLVL
jgi:hypothetical protein